MRLAARRSPLPPAPRQLAAAGRLPARHELLPRPTTVIAARSSAALAATLAAGGYAVDPSAGRGMCIIVEILGRYEERPCGSLAHPEFPGFCGHHVSKIRRLDQLA
jgi:hypothetical protein